MTIERFTRYGPSLRWPEIPEHADGKLNPDFQFLGHARSLATKVQEDLQQAERERQQIAGDTSLSDIGRADALRVHHGQLTARLRKRLELHRPQLDQHKQRHQRGRVELLARAADLPRDDALRAYLMRIESTAERFAVIQKALAKQDTAVARLVFGDHPLVRSELVADDEQRRQLQDTYVAAWGLQAGDAENAADLVLADVDEILTELAQAAPAPAGPEPVPTAAELEAREVAGMRQEEITEFEDRVRRGRAQV